MTVVLSHAECPNDIIIRPLTPADSKAYRALRKRILEMGDGKYFSASYRRDQQFITEQQWNEWCTETHEHCIIGTFVGSELVGIMTIVEQEPASNLTAEWDSTWLDPKYRKYGIAKCAYQRVAQWTKEHGYKLAEVFIRDENTRSREIRERQGAVYTHTKHNEIWADGSVGDAHFFTLELSCIDLQQAPSYTNAARHLESTLEALQENVLLPQEAVSLPTFKLRNDKK